VLVTHGASDLVTPYFESQLIIDQLPAFGSAERLRLGVYGGGHMYYSRDASRRAMREDAERLYRATEVSTPSDPPAKRGTELNLKVDGTEK
jgi:carboxypeptidase C (cathepsin A)